MYINRNQKKNDHSMAFKNLEDMIVVFMILLIFLTVDIRCKKDIKPGKLGVLPHHMLPTIRRNDF